MTSVLLPRLRVSPALTVLLLLPLLVWAHGDHSTAPWSFLLTQFSSPFQSSYELWTYSFASTALISAAPFFILFFIPLQNAKDHASFLKVLLSFASGGLLGDAFLHLIPHATSPHDHHAHDHHDHDHAHHHHGDHHHDHHHHEGGDHAHHHHHGDHHAHDHMQDMIVGLWVLAGVVTFLAVEKFVRLAKGGHGHSHGHAPSANKEIEEKDPVEAVKEQKGEDGTLRKRGGKPNGKPNSNTKPPSKKAAVVKSIKVSAYLNLAADFAHNFTDGLAIGASYLAGRGVGLVTTLTILFHEVPHEIGDFAILVQSGYSKRRAMFLQLGTAVGAMAGTACGLFLEGVGASTTLWVLPFTAGGFIYIATVSVIPELLENTKLWQSLMEMVAMGVGIGMMVLITFIE